MALVLSNSIFYHVPKTGGQWVGKVFHEMELVEWEYREENHPMGVLNLTKEHISPLYAKKDIIGNKLSFAFVRNPMTWYQSLWKYKRTKWDEPYVKYGSDDFNTFMEKIMRLAPKFLTRVYKEFDSVDFLGKQENLRNDLISILETLGEDVDYEVVAMSPVFGATKDISCEYDPKILKKMKKLESWIFKKYYPEDL